VQGTFYLLRSPANATRLLKAINDSRALTIPRTVAAELDRINAVIAERAMARRSAPKPNSRSAD